MGVRPQAQVVTKLISWKDVRDDAVARFKSFPPANDEASLLEAFERSPEAVMKALDYVAGRSDIRAPWRIWAMECRRSGNDVVVQAGPSRDKQVGRAESHLRVAGLYLPSEDEVREAYFGHGGLLNAWRGDGILEERIVGLWRELQSVVDADVAAMRERDSAWLELGRPVLVKRWARVTA